MFRINFNTPDITIKNTVEQVNTEDWNSPILSFTPQNSSAVSSGTSGLWNQNTKALLHNATRQMGIRDYTPTLLDSDVTAIKKSQGHIIDLIKYYEGDRYHYYEAWTVPYKDCGGTWTTGFGNTGKNKVNSNSRKTQEEAYKDLTEKLESCANEVKRNIKSYDSLPQSIKEALIDLCYNKGLHAVTGNSDLKQAIADKDWSKVVANVVYVKSAKTKEVVPGLYTRSLSRAILATRDLTGDELKQAKEEIDRIYNKAKSTQGTNKQNLQKIYELYKKGSTSILKYSYPSGKHTVQRGETYYAIAQKYAVDGVDISKLVEEIKKINNNRELQPDDVITIPASFQGKQLKGVQGVVNTGSNASSGSSGTKTSASTQSGKTSQTTKNNNTAKIAGKAEITDKKEKFEITEDFRGKGFYAVAKSIHDKYLTPSFNIMDLSNKIQAMNKNVKFEVGVVIDVPVIKVTK